MTTREAFRAIARSCLKQFRLNEPALVAEREPESLHQARVAIRRLRSALSIFDKIVVDVKGDAIRSELKALSAKLGEARNLDVYWRDVIEPKRRELLPEADIETDAAQVAAARERAYDVLIEHLGSRRFRLFTIDLARWIETGTGRSGGIAHAPESADVWSFAEEELRRRRKSVAKKGRHLTQLDPEGRHRVRIGAKKLRYASDFFASLFEGGRARKRQARFVSRLEDLQDALGALNDLRIGHDVATHLVGEDARPFAAGPLTPGDAEHETSLLDAAEAAHRRFRRVRFL